MRPTLLACLFTCLVPSAAAAVVDAGSDALPTTGYHTYAKGRHVGLPRRGILGWRKGCLDVAVANCRRSGTCHLLDLYEFGVFTGRALKGMASYLRAPPGGGPAVPIDTMWGFDSFQGIPSEESDSAAGAKYAGAATYEKMVRGDWRAGSYNAADALQVYSFSALIQKLRTYIGLNRTGIAGKATPLQNVRFIRGFFNESLTPSLALSLGMRPALFVDLDVDIFSSTVQASTWLIQSRLLQRGAVVGYDDWMGDASNASTISFSGQSRSHFEVLEPLLKARGLRARRIDNPYPNACFELVPAEQ